MSYVFPYYHLRVILLQWGACHMATSWSSSALQVSKLYTSGASYENFGPDEP